MTEQRACGWSGASGHNACPRPARMAVLVTRPTRGDLRVIAYADDRTAPKTATPYCREHGTGTVTDLLTVVVDGDDTPTPTKETP